MKKFIPVLFLIFAISCNSLRNNTNVTITEGYFDCFSEGLMQENGSPYTCETSTVLYSNGKIYLANDKPMPEKNSPVFSFDYDKKILCSTKKYYQTPAFYLIDKYESSTITPDNKFILFSSAFSYPVENKKKGPTNNTLIYIEADNFDNSGVVKFDNDTAKNSFDLKNQFVNVLKSDKYPNGPNYLKIEAMTVIPDNKILFGVREIGNEYNDFEYSITILSVDYEYVDNKIKLRNSVEKIYEIPADTLGNNILLGISSMEYSRYDKRIYFVTSYELGDDTKSRGAYLWYISIDELNKNKNAHLVYTDAGQPMKFDHKIEGLTVLGKKTLLLIGDDDRITGLEEENPLFTRNLNQGYWCIVKVK